MKVIFFVPNMTQVGGIERLVSILANKFSNEHKLNVEIINLGKRKCEEKFTFESNIEIKYMNIEEKSLEGKGIVYKVIYTFNHFNKVRRYFNKYKFKDEKTIIIAFGHTLSLMLARAINSKQNIKLIGSQHNPISYNKVYNVLRKIYMPKLDKYVVLNDDMKNDLQKNYSLSNIIVIENPNTLVNKKISNINNKQVLAVGRLTEQKDFGTLIDIWSNISKNHKGWKLKIIGEGPLKSQLKNKIESYNLRDSIFIENFTDEISLKYFESDIFVMTSIYEGFGLVLVEAQSCGLPTISFNCPFGPKNIINDDVDGYLINNRDINEFSKKLTVLMENECVRRKMSQKAIENSKRFDIDLIIQKWIELFDQIW